MVQQAVALSVGSVLSRSFSIWGRNLLPFSLLALIIQSPAILYCAFGPLNTPTQAFVYSAIVLIATLAANTVTSASVAYGVFQQLRGQPTGFVDCVRVGLSRLVPVLGVGFAVTGFALVGLLGLIVGAIVVLCILYVAVPAAVVEALGVRAALQRSASLTKGVRPSIFGIIFVLALVGIGVNLVIHLVYPDPNAPRDFRRGDDAFAYVNAMKVYGRELAAVLHVRTPIELAVGAILGVLGSIAAVIVYYDLRVQKEHVNLEEIATVFD